MRSSCGRGASAAARQSQAKGKRGEGRPPRPPDRPAETRPATRLSRPHPALPQRGRGLHGPGPDLFPADRSESQGLVIAGKPRVARALQGQAFASERAGLRAHGEREGGTRSPTARRRVRVKAVEVSRRAVLEKADMPDRLLAFIGKVVMVRRVRRAPAIERDELRAHRLGPPMFLGVCMDQSFEGRPLRLGLNREYGVTPPPPPPPPPPPRGGARRGGRRA